MDMKIDHISPAIQSQVSMHRKTMIVSLIVTLLVTLIVAVIVERKIRLKN